MSKEILMQMERDYKNAFPINIEWLLEYAKEQTKHVEELERDYKEVFDLISMRGYQNRLDMLNQNKHYREVLEFYADITNHKELRGSNIFGDVFYDAGKKARNALNND